MNLTDKVYEERKRAQTWLDEVLRTGEIDEVALFLDSEKEVYLLGRQLVQTGWVWTNSADDKVHTEPFNTDYDVQYDFFAMRGDFFRLEIMRGAHSSPLHAALRIKSWGDPEPDYVLTVDGQPLDRIEPIMVHTSFKVHGKVEDYERICADLAEAGCVPAQRCVSTYGQFSYWRAPKESGMVTYLKPRINLRDAT